MVCLVDPHSLSCHDINACWHSYRYISMTDETVAQIAKRYGCNADEIVRLNKDRVKKLNAKAKLWEG